MEYLIKNTTNNTYFFGCFDISAFDMPYYNAFGDANVAEAYYTLQDAISQMQFILKHDQTIQAEQLKIHIPATGEDISIEQAVKLAKKTKSKSKKQTKNFYKQLNLNIGGKNGI